MRKTKHILIPTDFSQVSENAFRYGLRLAEKLDAEITVLHIVYPQYEAMDVPVMSAQGTKLRMEAAKEALKSFMDRGLNHARDGSAMSVSAKVQSEIEIGSPVNVIGNYTEDGSFDLVLLGTQGEHNNLEKFLGTVSSGVVNHSKVPVLLIPEGASFTEIDKIAYATNFNSAEAVHVRDTIDLLGLMNVKLDLVHFDKSEKEKEIEKITFLKNTFRDAPGSYAFQFHTLEGDSLVESLNHFVEVHNVQLLVMFKQQRSFFDRLLHHSQTRDMAMSTAVPLLILKEN